MNINETTLGTIPGKTVTQKTIDNVIYSIMTNGSLYWLAVADPEFPAETMPLTGQYKVVDPVQAQYDKIKGVA